MTDRSIASRIRRLRAVAALAVVLAMLAGSTTSTEATSRTTKRTARTGAKSSSRKTTRKPAQVTLGALRRSQLQRDRVRAKRAKAAAKLQASKASSDQATEALAALNSRVRLTGVALEKAQRSANRASATAAEARQKERSLTKRLDGMRDRQRLAALDAFAGGLGSGSEEMLSAENASDAGRRAELNSMARRSSADVIDELAALQEDLGIQRAIAVRAEKKAKTIRATVADRLADFESARTSQAKVAAAAEDQLEARLAEAQSLRALDSSLAAQIASQNEALAKQIRSGVGFNGGGKYGGGSLPSIGSIGSVSTSGGGDLHGIVVASSIRGDLARLLAAAKADGIYFGGGGYRSSASQINLRRAHCGSSSFAIYQMRSSQCRPPTARPGASQHERGLAIDFTQNGRGLTRGSSGYRWLRGNAHRFGFYNLPSEPWHWSRNGR